MIRAVIFDCFGVLYVDSSHYFYQREIASLPDIEQEVHDLHKRYDRGWMSFEQYTAEIAELAGLGVDYVRENIHGHVKLNQQLLDYSQGLRASYQLALLSNVGPGAMERYFTSQQQAKLFDAVVLSSDVGLAKPDPAIYQLTAERLGVDTSQCLMIDDAEVNCDGARRAGMMAVLYDGTTQSQASIETLLKKY